MMKKIKMYAFAVILVLLAISFSDCKKWKCTKATEEKSCCVESGIHSHVKHVEWSRNAIMYEVNLRQHTRKGTFKEFTKDLPRLKKLGVKIIWLMPIHPISKKKRKGKLGSYYAVADYKKVNPEFGTMSDFKNLVKKTHELGMYVIIDWVANHTGWDNPWINQHPDWFTQNENGEIIDPIDPNTGKSWGWTDVADLNFDSKEMRAAMIDALKFWITETDIDGYRCDVAHNVPKDFWEKVKAELDKLKPVFMLAEAEQFDLLVNAFDMHYAWEFHHLMNAIAKGKKNALDIEEYYKKERKKLPKDAFVLNFITNHDENAWNGTVEERMGKGGKTFAVLTYCLPGMPLLYSGQEVGLNKRLKFFEKDYISWKDRKKLQPFYVKLGKLKQANKALNCGESGGKMKLLNTTNNEAIFAFFREKDGNKVMVILNLTPKAQKIEVDDKNFAGNYTDFFTHKKKTAVNKMAFNLNPWEYKVFVK